MLNDMSPEWCDVFRTVARENEAVFTEHILNLGIGDDRELIRWTVKELDPEKIAATDRLNKMLWGKISKASAIYEYDTGKKYIVEVVAPIWEVLNHAEQNALAYYLLSRIAVNFDKMDNVKFGINSTQYADFATRLRYGDQCLPTSEQLSNRLKGAN